MKRKNSKVNKAESKRSIVVRKSTTKLRSKETFDIPTHIISYLTSCRACFVDSCLRFAASTYVEYLHIDIYLYLPKNTILYISLLIFPMHLSLCLAPYQNIGKLGIEYFQGCRKQMHVMKLHKRHMISKDALRLMMMNDE